MIDSSPGMVKAAHARLVQHRPGEALNGTIVRSSADVWCLLVESGYTFPQQGPPLHERPHADTLDLYCSTAAGTAYSLYVYPLPAASVAAGAVSMAAPAGTASATVPVASLAPGALNLVPAAVAVAASVPGGALDTSVRFQPAALAVPGTMPAAAVGLGPVTLAPGVTGAAPTLLATAMALGAVAIAPSALPVGVVVMGGSIAPEIAACLAVTHTSATALLLSDAPVTTIDLLHAPAAALALVDAPVAVLALGHAWAAELVLADECEGQPWPT